jgi:hypothetical protein
MLISLSYKEYLSKESVHLYDDTQDFGHRHFIAIASVIMLPVKRSLKKTDTGHHLHGIEK